MSFAPCELPAVSPRWLRPRAPSSGAVARARRLLPGSTHDLFARRYVADSPADVRPGRLLPIRQRSRRFGGFGVKPLVLMYHGVGCRRAESDPYNLFVSPTELAAHLSSLLGRGWRPLTLPEYLAARAGPHSFLVTFDDGYESVHDIALPLLTQLGVPATVFVCSGVLGGSSHWMPELAPEPLVSAGQVVALRDGGFDIGLHGLDHTLLPGLPPDQLQAQTSTAARRLAEVTGEWPRAFAYPAGAHDAAARASVAAAGIEVAFATHAGSGPFAVRRIDVNSTDTSRSFRLKTTRGYPLLRRAAGVLPGLRPTLHAMIGSARREP